MGLKRPASYSPREFYWGNRVQLIIVKSTKNIVGNGIVDVDSTETLKIAMKKELEMTFFYKPVICTV